MNELRKDRRAPASLKVKYKSATVDEFIEQFGADVSRGGIFIKTKKPLDTGALLKFEFQLQGGAPVIHGVGRVAWRRGEGQARADLPAGMGIKFIKLDERSRAVIERIESRHGAGSRFDQTEAAEMAPPLSSIPPGPGLTPPPGPRPPQSALNASLHAAGGRPTPLVPAPLVPARASSPTSATQPRMNGPKPAAAPVPPTFRPPPPAMSSIPPALGDAWRSAPPSSAPKGVLGGASSAARKPIPSGRTAARDTSEFLASAFSVGGAGAEVRNQAQAQVERARRDPQSVDLANELFGDLSEPSQRSAPAEALDDSLDQTLAALDPEPLRALSSDPKPQKPLSPEERSLADKIPSIEDLVNEVGNSGPAARRASVAEAARVAENSPPPMAAAMPANDSKPLSLELAPSFGSERASAAAGAKPSSVGLTLVLGGVLCVVVAAGAYVVMRGKLSPALTEPAPAASQPSAAAVPGGNVEHVATASHEPKPPASGTIVAVPVSSDPRGAEVTIDGKPGGVTPLSLSLVAHTPVEVSFRSPGFATKTEKLTPNTGMAPLHVALTPLVYELTIVTEPKGSLVKVGESSAESPNPVALGHIDAAVTASVEKDGFQRMSRSVGLDEFQERDGKMRAELALSLPALPPPAAARRKTIAAARAVRMAAPPAPAAPSGEPEPGESPVMLVKPAGSEPAAPVHEAPAPEPRAAPPAAAAPPAPAEPAAPPKPAPSEPAAAPAPAAP